MKNKLKVSRFIENNFQTLSNFDVLDECNLELFSGFILELSNKENKNSISRIPEGIYTCVKRNSKKYGDHFHVLDVVGRSYILIHHGNYFDDTKGCLLPGRKLVDIDGDGLKDVTSSKKTMTRLNHFLPKKFELCITNKFDV
jgi:hypothetical protein